MLKMIAGIKAEYSGGRLPELARLQAADLPRGEVLSDAQAIKMAMLRHYTTTNQQHGMSDQQAHEEAWKTVCASGARLRSLRVQFARLRSRGRAKSRPLN